MKELTLDNINIELKNVFSNNDNFEYTYISHNVEDTKKLGYNFADFLEVGTIITLNGELGSGKTVFLNGVASFFNISDEVSSPTFTIVNEYNISKGFPIYHFDVYRIKSSDEFVDSIGTDYFYNGACIIEWGDEIINDILPQNTIHIDIYKDSQDKDLRIFKIWRKK